MKHLLIILISFLLLSSPVIGQSGKPLGVIFPPTIMGNVSDSLKQILLNTLDDELSQYFDVSPTTNVSSQDLPVVSEVFQLQIVEEDGDTQLSMRWTSGKERKVETILCGGCKTIELNGKLVGLVDKMIGKKVKRIVSQEEINNSEQNIQIKENYSNGNKYVGELKNGKRNTQITEVYSNGNKYVGELKNGKRNGQGTYSYSNGNKYVGSWKNGVPWNGTGFKINGDIKYILVNGKME
jgi:hypothetical protein